MATNGTPFEGRDNIIAPKVYVPGTLQLVLYTNTPNSLNDQTVLADLTAPVGTGYAAVTLSGAFAAQNGVVTYDDGTPDNVQFQNTGGTNWTANPTGSAITDGTYLLHFKDFALGAIIMTPGKKIEIDISSLVQV